MYPPKSLTFILKGLTSLVSLIQINLAINIPKLDDR